MDFAVSDELRNKLADIRRELASRAVIVRTPGELPADLPGRFADAC